MQPIEIITVVVAVLIVAGTIAGSLYKKAKNKKTGTTCCCCSDCAHCTHCIKRQSGATDHSLAK